MKNFPGNPMLIHTIQDRLLRLTGNSILEIAIYNAARTAPKNAVSLIISCHEDNPGMMREILGADLMGEILAYNAEQVNNAEPESGAYAD